MLVTVFVDESGTHNSGMTILGGWVGRLGQWSQFDLQWRRLLAKSGVPYFHARKLRHGKRPFSGWTAKQKALFMSNAIHLAKKHLGFGFTVSLVDGDYDEHYAAGDRPKKTRLDSRYALCVRHAICGAVPLAKAFFERDLDIHFVLERGHKNYASAERAFYEIKDSKSDRDRHISSLLRTCTPGDKVEFPGLQAADLNAYLAFQAYTRTPVPSYELDTNPEIAIKQASKVQMVRNFNFPLSPAMLEKYRLMVWSNAQERLAYGLASVPRLMDRKDAPEGGV